jgi:MFS family permease
MVVFSTAPFLYLLVSSPWQLVGVRIYHGLATANLGPVAMATVADLYNAAAASAWPGIPRPPWWTFHRAQPGWA